MCDLVHTMFRVTLRTCGRGRVSPEMLHVLQSFARAFATRGVPSLVRNGGRLRVCTKTQKYSSARRRNLAARAKHRHLPLNSFRFTQPCVGANNWASCSVHVLSPGDAMGSSRTWSLAADSNFGMFRSSVRSSSLQFFHRHRRRRICELHSPRSGRWRRPLGLWEEALQHAHGRCPPPVSPSRFRQRHRC